jgi:DinB superfamily
VDVQATPAALDELRDLGVPLVPAVSVGKRAVHGWNPPAYAELLGIDYRPAEKLPPAELGRRLDRILECTESLLAAIPDDRMEWKPPQRDRTIRDLGYHVFRLSLAFPDGMDLGRLPEEWLQEKTPPDLADGAAIARYGALVRGRLGGWFEGAGAGEFRRVIDVYYGPQGGHELLERTTWHAAQHLRQLYAMADVIGVAPPEAMPSAAFEGLPLPASLW